jgi:PhnB protein
MTRLNPYLFFDGNCEEAFDFYSSVFRAGLRIARFKDAPQTDRQIFHEADGKIMHVSLPLNTATTLMGADVSGMYKQPVNNFALYINTDIREEAERLFKELSAGGQVSMPMTETFWGAYYGNFTDKFGISWKISFSLNAEE